MNPGYYLSRPVSDQKLLFHCYFSINAGKIYLPLLIAEILPEIICYMRTESGVPYLAYTERKAEWEQVGT